MQEQIRPDRLLQRRAEAGHQVMRKVAHESDGIAEQHGHPVVHAPSPRAGIQRGEKLIRHVHARAGQQVHQRAFAGVGVADQADVEGVFPAADLAHLAPVDFGDAALEIRHAFLGELAVDLDLLFARTSRADASDGPGRRGRPAGNPLKVRPHVPQPRIRVLQLSQLDLQPAGAGAGVRGENIQNQLAAVQHLPRGDLLQVAYLGRRKIVIENDRVGAVLLGAGGNFARLARTDIHARMNPPAANEHLIDDVGPGRPRQAAQLAHRVGRVGGAAG